MNIIAKKLSIYFSLVRLHQRAGIWLVMWPGIWSITMASDVFPNLKLCLIFILGSVLMRSAGCIINDIFDRNFDKQVARTANRPLASGKISLIEALIILFILLAASLSLLLQLNNLTKFLGVLSLIPITIYPLMKRITYWPQAFLGLTFNFAALMGWTAICNKLNIPAVLPLYCMHILDSWL